MLAVELTAGLGSEAEKDMWMQEAEKSFRERVRAGELKHDPLYDAYYDVATGEWHEPKCRDADCEFCTNRPAKHHEPNAEVKGAAK